METILFKRVDEKIFVLGEHWPERIDVTAEFITQYGEKTDETVTFEVIVENGFAVYEVVSSDFQRSILRCQFVEGEISEVAV